MRSLPLCSLSLLLSTSAIFATDFYVDPAKGNDIADGSQARPFKTIAQAIKVVDGVGGTVHLSPDSGPYRENMLFKKGGTPDKPIIIEGQGSVINLGKDVTTGPWINSGGEYTLDKPVSRNSRDYVATVAFVNGLPLYCAHPKGTGIAAWHGGSARYDEQGRLVLTFPSGLTPETSVVVLPSVEPNDCCVNIAQYTTIRDLTAAFAPNDGFNIHGKGKNILLERVKGVFNGDQGISSHDLTQVDVKDSEVAFDGSSNGGITDVQDCVTTYQNVRVHQNRGSGFVLSGAHHTLEHVTSFGNIGRNLPKPTDKIEIVDCQDLGAVPSDKEVPLLTSGTSIGPKDKVEETDRLNRFLQLRPPSTPVTISK